MPTQTEEPDFGLVLFCAYPDSAGNTPPECFFGRTIRWPTREDRECLMVSVCRSVQQTLTTLFITFAPIAGGAKHLTVS